jgi:1-aminocyclopropane-1-carboxylate deaminase/D-cysteine desulfhydrase-like pyridoxal-dependent ACC family enzyme
MRQAVLDGARYEGLLLDPVYTGKAIAGLRMLVANGRIPRGARVLFWHTGGAPALFGYPEIFSNNGESK